MLKKFRAWQSRSWMAARDRWSKPLSGSLQYCLAWASLFFADHGFLRLLYWNSGKVNENIWRGPQPNPFHLKRLARKGLKTIVNLRGPTAYGSYALERETAHRLGLHFVDVALYSGGAPRQQQIHALHGVFKTMELPALLHCKSGADRSGLAAALYLILIEDVPVALAAKQMSRRYGHIKSSKTGILDAFFEKYLADTSRMPMPFLRWVDEMYNPHRLDEDFAKPSLKRMIVDFFVRRE